MTRGLYAILDKKAADLVGGIMAITIHSHVATAVRMFNDIATSQNSQIAKYPEDFALIYLGGINLHAITDDDQQITEIVANLQADSTYTVVLEGTVWAANQQAAAQLTTERQLRKA